MGTIFSPALEHPHGETPIAMPDLYLVALLALDELSKVPLFQQIVTGLRRGILEGQVAPGTRLPSIRDMAKLLEVSRNTVVGAYNQLLDEGYLETRRGAGTFVCDHLPESFLQTSSTTNQEKPDPSRKREASRRSSWVTSLPPTSVLEANPNPAFRYGLPALEYFPWDTWARMTSHCYRYPQFSSFDYHQMSGGFEPLREELAAYLCSARGLRCDASQVIVTSGAQQGIYMAAHLLADPGDKVWLEDPGYRGAKRCFQNAGLSVAPVEVDGEGLCVKRGREEAPSAKLAFVTPSRHHPLGVTMSLQRRVELLEWAQQSGAWILEDDYDSEFRYEGRPLPSLQGLDPYQRVIYVGTLSKTLFPALRLGYLVVPKDKIEIFVNFRGIIDTYTPTLTQRVLARFIQEGHFTRHIRKMRQVYAKRKEQFLEVAEDWLGDAVQWEAADAGMSLTGWLSDGRSDVELSQNARDEGLFLSPISTCYANEEKARQGIAFGFTGCNKKQMKEGMEKLARCLGRER
ncbi:MAG: PLP-dependent aminotransferase family protein [Deltaproteobacteria bacterium]|nr:MAG: PLP-dependent aminotransferase family protein [Deltaproteobacteria bacterium]